MEPTSGDPIQCVTTKNVIINPNINLTMFKC